MIQRQVFSAAALGALLTAAASAQEGGMRQLGAHVHGAAELIAAADPGGLVVAELSTPAWNLYGFETAATTGAQAETVAAVGARLAEAGLVTFASTAGCVLSETAVIGAPQIALEGEGSGGGDDHAPHDHQDHHDHHDHDAHGHGHDDHSHDDHAHDDPGGHDHGDHGHADVVVNWSFACESPDRLGALDLSGLFAAFERMERVEVQYLDADTAAARQLTPADAVLRLN